MTVYYSAAQRGFYDSTVHAVIPPDAVKVEPADYAALLQAQADGADIVADGSRRPTAKFPPKPDPFVMAKAAALAAVQSQLSKKIAEGFPYQGKVVQIDADSRANLTAAAAMAQANTLPNPFAWRMLDNSDVPLNGPMLIQLASNIGAHYYALLKRAWALKADVAKAKDMAGLAGFDPTAGWPAPPA